MTEKIDIQNLERRLVALGGQPHKRVVQVSWDFYTPEVKAINEALARGTNEERLELTKDLYSLYRSDDLENAKKVFGDVSPIGPMRVMGTIAHQGEQFRIWHGIPGHISREHADSCGENLILGVYGNSEDVRKYVETLMPRMQEAELPNGVKVMMYSSFH